MLDVVDDLRLSAASVATGDFDVDEGDFEGLDDADEGAFAGDLVIVISDLPLSAPLTMLLLLLLLLVLPAGGI